MKNVKLKGLIMVLFIMILLFIIPNISEGAVNVTRNIYSNNGSMKFEFTGLTLDKTHLYEFGLTKVEAAGIEKWYDITEYTETSATVNITTTTKELREIINQVDTGYITIRDKSDNSIVLNKHSVDLKTPYLQLTNYTVIPNGKVFNVTDKTIQIALRNAHSSKAYYQYEKITDTNIINKYKEIKGKNGDFNSLQSILKTTVPTSNWNSWDFWNGYDMNGTGGYGYTSEAVSTPGLGLYYMWLYFSGNNVKDVYGYILVDSLEADIELESITIPKTENLEMGKTLTITPTFSPSEATNKAVTWSSSDESVATVSNAGVVTPKKIGKAIITVTSQDGAKKASCTVTVIEEEKNNSENKNGTTNNNKGTSNGKDTTTIKGILPKTGVSMGIAGGVLLVFIFSIIFYKKYKKFNI